MSIFGINETAQSADPEVASAMFMRTGELASAMADAYRANPVMYNAAEPNTAPPAPAQQPAVSNAPGLRAVAQEVTVPAGVTDLTAYRERRQSVPTKTHDEVASITPIDAQQEMQRQAQLQIDEIHDSAAVRTFGEEWTTPKAKAA